MPFYQVARMIAEETSSTPMTISRYRKELESEGRIKSVEKRLGLDEKERGTAQICAVEKTVDPFKRARYV